MKVGERKGKREGNGQGRTKLFPEDIFRRRHLKRYELKISFSKLGGIDAVVDCAGRVLKQGPDLIDLRRGHWRG